MQNITTINSVETSSLCNNKCQYCPAPVQGEHRETGLMSMEVFRQTITWIKHFVAAETQLEVNLFGVGEPTLNPAIVDMVRYARLTLPPAISIHLNSNGKTMTKELAIALKDAGLTHCDLTGHDAYHTAKAIKIFKEVGIQGCLSFDFITEPNNWAGQVDWFAPDYRYPCPWLERGQVMVMSNGDISTCCIAAFGQGVIGSIDDNVPELMVKPFDLCEACHQDIPARMRATEVAQ